MFKAVSLTKILTKLENCKYRIGLTGTLDDSKTHKLVLEGLFGAVNKVISTKTLQDNKQLADLKIYFVTATHPKRLDGSRQNFQEIFPYMNTLVGIYA